MNQNPSDMILMGVLGASVGLKGHLKFNYYSQNIDAINNKKFYYGNNFENSCTLKIVSLSPKKLVVSIDGVQNRNDSETWCNRKLYVPRDSLPTIKNDYEYYITDLIGVDVFSPAGEKIGSVKQVHNFGAGDIIEIITLTGNDVMLIFTNENFPNIDLQNNKIICNQPDVMLIEK